ncbi:hypothetical protein BDV18DRAFT_73152 [Aspergillus unguis]
MPPKGRRDIPLRILDLCTGTGCIPLLLHSLLAPRYSELAIVGVDISDAAVQLANENTKRNVRLALLSRRALREIGFQKRNVLEYGSREDSTAEDVPNSTSDDSGFIGSRWDVLISNPPYVSLSEYCDGTTSRSVRTFEPRLALVPPDTRHSPTVNNKHVQHEDTFYYHIAFLVLNMRVKLAVLECGSRSQALRVASLCRDILRLHAQVEQMQVRVDIWSASEFSAGPSAVLIYVE